MIRKIWHYLNPIEYLGNRDYSVFFALSTTLAAILAGELLVSPYILKDAETYGLYAIIVFLALIIYFSFRKGIVSGIITSLLTVGFYFYIIYSRHYTDRQLYSGIQTTLVLGILYLLLATVIGWLKQTIDTLIEREADEKVRLYTIIEQLPVGVLITDSKGLVVQTNKQLSQILGQKIPLGSMAGKESLVEGLNENGEEMQGHHSPVAKALFARKPITGKEFVIEKSGKKTYIRVNAAPVKNKKGKIIAAASIVSDITEQRALEKRKDDFINMASHELKTPITSIKLYIDLISRKVKTGQTAKLLGSLKEQTNRLQELVRELLDVSRMQTGKLSFSKEEFRLDRFIEATITELDESQKGPRLIFAKKIPVSVRADKFRIYQVLTNLVMNAKKYSPHDSTIYLRMSRGKKTVTVSVQDYGIGIDRSEQEKIFDRLYQVSDDREKTFPGFGMGLYIAKEIITRHKGTIWVESEKGKGSTFYFTLPR